MSQAPLIAFEGLIGAGKTTLADRLSEHTGYSLVLERFDDNAFLSDFYADRVRWALPMQLWFLTERHKQLEQVAGQRHTPIVADYSGIKNEVFASLLLEGRESRLYADLAASLSRAVRLPDLLVYLDADNDILLDRINRRARCYESSIDATYLNDLRKAYEIRLSTRMDVRVVRVDTTALDLSSTAQMGHFFERILESVRL